MRNGAYRIEKRDDLGKWRPCLQWSYDYGWVTRALAIGLEYDTGVDHRIVDIFTGEVILQVKAIVGEQQ